ncbi:MAG: hypothetical protein JST59_20650 [Actinobacteria bacterium]|nr:hypothetical protein [Actinomycetota bacterium]
MNCQTRIGWPRVALLSGLIGLALVACLGGTAPAAQVHVYSHSFGKGELSLTWESGMDVNQESGEVYVADTQHSRIRKFTTGGNPDGTLANIPTPTFLAVDNSTGPSHGDIYVAGESDKSLYKFTPAGLPVSGWGVNGRLGELGEILGLAVDPDGNLLVLSQDLKLNEVEEEFFKIGAPLEDTVTLRIFDQSGASTPGNGWEHHYGKRYLAFPGDMAADGGGDLYLPEMVVTNGAKGGLPNAWDRYVRQFEELGPEGEVLTVPFTPEGTGGKGYLGIALDLADDNYYLGSITQHEGTINKAEPASLYSLRRDRSVVEHFGGSYEGPVARLNSSIDGLEDISSIATDETGGELYVADPQSQKVAVFSLEEVLPPAITMEQPDSIGQTSAHVVGHIDPNAPAGSAASHDVAWHYECTPACPGHEGYIAADEVQHVVEATISGLVPGTSYSVKLVGMNRGATASSATEEFKTASAPPSVTDTVVSGVHEDEATLGASINPNGAETSYYFEYLTKAAFDAEGFGGSKAVRTPATGGLGPAPSILPVSVRIRGLVPATEYVFRAVAANSIGTTDGPERFFRSQVGRNPLEAACPNQSLRTEFGANLPDCRAYELVSPIEKSGNNAQALESFLQVTPDGSAVTWYSGQSATGIPSPGVAHQDSAFYLSSLLAGGWSSQRLLLPESYGELVHLSGLTEDSRFAVMETAVGRGGIEPGLYLLDTIDGRATAIVPPQVGQAVPTRAFAFDGASEDDSLFFFETRLRLTPNAATGKNNLYVWDREEERVSLAGVLPGAKAEAPAGGSFGGAYNWSGANSSLTEGGAEKGQYVGAIHAISESGDSVYFTAGETAQIYLRQGLTGIKPSTVRVSVPNAGVSDPNGQQPAAFQEATPDGAKAFFLSNGRLTSNANTGPADEGTDLYLYDTGTKKLVDVTPDPAGAGARVRGLMGISSDGTAGFLVARGVLASGGVSGRENIYHFERSGEGYAYRFVAQLLGSIADARNWTPQATEARTARVSKDGNSLLFLSQGDLNGGSLGGCPVGSCMQVYRYSMGEGVARCLSCNPTGEGIPVVGAELTSEAAPFLKPENVPLYGTLPRNLSSSGDRVFFQAGESLLPEDVNSLDPRQNCTEFPLVTCEDVYEWEAPGTGSCTTPNQAGGCLYLLSTGDSNRSSYFVGASAEGESAFLVTNSPLVLIDEDGLSDVYDVRIDGGLASQHVGPAEPCHSSAACGGTRVSPGPSSTPGSQSFVGPGNTKVTRCKKKGFVRKQRKCVKKSGKHKRKQPRKGRPRHHGGKQRPALKSDPKGTK